MIFDMKLYAQFHPRREFELTAVVEQNRNTPVRIVESANAPFRPKLGTCMLLVFRYWKISSAYLDEETTKYGAGDTFFI